MLSPVFRQNRCSHTLAAGFCAVSKSLPLPQSMESDANAVVSKGAGGLNTAFGQTFHCVAAEPNATILYVSVSDCGREVAYETAVLGKLWRGWHILNLRSLHGTRIELCFMFVRISLGSEDHATHSPRQARAL